MWSTAKFKRIKLTARDVMKPMIALLFLNIIALTVWTIIDPLQLQSEQIGLAQDKFVRDVEAYSVCSSDHASIFIAILRVINLGSCLFSSVQAYQARNIPTDLSESRYLLCNPLYSPRNIPWHPYHDHFSRKI